MGLNRLRRLFEPAIRRGMHFYWRFSRAATLGVRAMVIDGSGRIFLVEHSYVEGWHLPGGGVETGETLLEALARELAEEGNIQIGATPQLYSVYFNRRMSRRDHVALFIVRDFRQDGDPQPDREIELRSDRNNAGRVHLPLAPIIMALDLLDADGLRNAGHLIEIAQIVRQVWKFGDV